MRIKVTFSLSDAWEEWAIEVPDDMLPDDPDDIDMDWISEHLDFLTENLDALLEAGNSGMDAEEVEVI